MHRLEPARTGDKHQQVKENHPSKTFNGASDENPEIGDGAGRFSNDFGNAAIAPKIIRMKTQGSLRWLADHIRDDATEKKEKSIQYAPIVSAIPRTALRGIKFRPGSLVGKPSRCSYDLECVGEKQVCYL